MLQCSSIDFCSYNFMLHKVPNSNDVTPVTNIVLNKVPNSKDATLIGNNVRLTTMGAQQFSMCAIDPSCRIANLPEMRDSDKITRKVCVVGNKVCPGKGMEAICPVV